MNAMTHQVAIKWLEHAGQQAPLWLIAQHESECCTQVQPGEQCEHKARCSQRERCQAVEVVRFAALHRGNELAPEAAQHVIGGRLAVIRTDTFITSEVRQ
ncbi:hypothetical protein [Azohydromonas lata]|uniref:hypothetical protein n=1 Tax=Azohydromonas lata TaxID=45677 RepID=UPI00083254A7|nr:hypothetical protein [Azohydromonas lata]